MVQLRVDVDRGGDEVSVTQRRVTGPVKLQLSAIAMLVWLQKMGPLEESLHQYFVVVDAVDRDLARKTAAVFETQLPIERLGGDV